MTWNVHGGVGTDRVFDLDRVARTVRRHRPDIVALQEVDSRRTGVDCAFDMLCEGVGSHRAEARLISAPDGDYGHVLVSRWPFVRTRVHSLSVDRREPRAAIEATVKTPHGDLHVVAVHLGLSLVERREQAALLSALADAGPAHSVVMGDFNDWLRRGSVRRALGSRLPDCAHFRTFPSWLPVLELDRIYCRPEGLIVHSWTDPQAWRASDHLPVIADIAAARLGHEPARVAAPEREPTLCAT